MSFKNRFTVLAALALTFALVVSGVLVFTFLRDAQLEQVDDSLRNHRPDIRFQQGDRNVETPDLNRNFRVVRVGPREDEQPPYLQLVTENGKVKPVPDSPYLPLPIAPAQRIAAQGGPPILETVTIDNERLRVLTKPLQPGLAISVARSLAPQDALLQRFVLIYAAAALAGLAFAILFGRAVAGALLRPVRKLIDTTEDVAASKDLGRRIEAKGAGELARLADSFNVMMEELDQSLSAQQRFVADASHELRTPLASMRTNLEVLAQLWDRMEPSDRQRLLNDVVEQTTELGELMTDLLELSKGGEISLDVEEVRLDEVAGGAIDQMRLTHPEHTFVADLHPVMVKAVPHRLNRAIVNLLENATKFNTPGRAIHVTVTPGELSVRDHGSGIAEEDLPHIFDRFYRSPRSREMPGSGLGLAIVRQVAEASGGSVTAANAVGGGAVFSMHLPAAPLPAPSPATQ